MFSRTWISKSTEGYSQKGERLKAEIQGADASLIGAGSGLSTSAGLTYGGERFLKYFSDFHEKYGITDMYSGGFYPFPSLEEYWAWWSRHIYCNRYDVTPGKPYLLGQERFRYLTKTQWKSSMQRKKNYSMRCPGKNMSEGNQKDMQASLR